MVQRKTDVNFLVVLRIPFHKMFRSYSTSILQGVREKNCLIDSLCLTTRYNSQQGKKNNSTLSIYLSSIKSQEVSNVSSHSAGKARPKYQNSFKDIVFSIIKKCLWIWFNDFFGHYSTSRDNWQDKDIVLIISPGQDDKSYEDTKS